MITCKHLSWEMLQVIRHSAVYKPGGGGDGHFEIVKKGLILFFQGHLGSEVRYAVPKHAQISGRGK